MLPRSWTEGCEPALNLLYLACWPLSTPVQNRASCLEHRYMVYNVE
jgi:hypothetical protein